MEYDLLVDGPVAGQLSCHFVCRRGSGIRGYLAASPGAEQPAAANRVFPVGSRACHDARGHFG